MKLPESFTKVTTFSKILAGTLFVILPFLGLYLGFVFGRSQTSQSINLTKYKLIKIPRSETREDLIRRCGDIPSNKLKINRQKFYFYKGPDWSPDCRYIAWSVIYNFTGGWLGETAYKPTQIIPYELQETNQDEGVYIYNDRTESIKKIYDPKIKKNIADFIGWKDKFGFEYKTKGKVYYYDVKLDTSTEVK